MFLRRFSEFAIPGLFSLLWSALACADNVTVGTGTPASCTEATLQAALPVLNPGIQAPGGVLGFNCGNDPHVLRISSPIFLSGDSGIDGGDRIVLDGQNVTRHVVVSDEGTRVTLRNIHLTRGFAANDFGGAVLVGTGSHLTMVDCTIDDSRAGLSGGAIAAFPGAFIGLERCEISGNRARAGGAIATSSNTTIRNSVFSNNGAEVDQGGALQVWHSTLVVDDSLFMSNFSGAGGAILQRGGAATITNTDFTANQSSLDGGAYQVYDNGIAAFQLAEFRSNLAHRDGGGIQVSPGDFADAPNYSANRVVLSSSLITNNRALRHGGGISVAAEPGNAFLRGEAYLTATVVEGNQAVRGGGIHLDGVLGYSASEIRAGSATDGGGIYVNNETASPFLHGANLVITNNVASGDGGGVCVQNGGGSPFSVGLSNLHIDTNRAFNGAGVAIRGLAGTELARVSLVGNEAINAGGGLYVRDDDTVVENTTFSGNRAIGGSNFGGAGGDIYVRNVAINFSTVDVAFSTLYFGDASQGSALFAEGAGPGVVSRIRINRSVVYPSPLSGPGAGSSGSALVESTGDNIGIDLPGCSSCNDVIVPTFTELALSALQPLANGTFGRTPESGSPIIDSVGCNGITIDQGGSARPSGGVCDRGAIERQPPIIDAMFANGFE